MSHLTYVRIGHIRRGAIVLAAAILLSSGLILLGLWESHRGQHSTWEPEDSVLVHNGRVYEKKAYTETFLVMGLDKFESDFAGESYVNDRQADFLMLLVLDHAAKTYTAIHINRDTMVPVHVLGVAGDRIDTVEKQIALAHTYGNGGHVSAHNTASSVSSLLLGMRVDHYVSLTMDAVSLYNDLLGGVEVEVLDDFAGIDDTLIKGEHVTLTGAQALTYVRARGGMEDSSNIARMRRQRQYMTALRDKTEARIERDESFMMDAVAKLSAYMVTDSSPTALQGMMRRAEEYAFSGIRTIEGRAVPGERFVEFLPDREAVERMVIEVFYQLKD